MAKYDVPGVAVAVTVDRQSYFFNYGVASKENATPVNNATLFEIGSISKTFTATLASYAQVLGKLSLDEHPGKYMRQLKGSAVDQASLMNLGTYTAGGLPLQFPDEVTPAKMVDYFQQWKPDAPVGTQRKYSNPSLGLFGHVTALALKSDFADAMERQIFPQLGLKHSYIHVPNNELVNYAWGYNQENRAIQVNPGVLAAETYGVKTTAPDLIRFVQANIDPSLLDANMQRAIEGTQVGYFKIGGMVQGLGWEQYAYPNTLERLLDGNSEAMIFESNPATPLSSPQVPSGPTLFDKTGSTGGFGAYVAFVPKKNIGIVILANKNYPIAARVTAAYTILDQLKPIAK